MGTTRPSAPFLAIRFLHRGRPARAGAGQAGRPGSAWYWPALLLVLVSAPAAGQDTPDLRLPLVIHLTRHDGHLVLPPHEVPLLVREVNRVYRQVGICFWLQETRELSRSGDLRTYRDRHAFAPLAQPGAVNIFLVHSIFDPESSASTVRTAARFGFKPDHWLDGAHIETPGRQPSSYALVRAEAGAMIVAHEIGHILGEGHSGDPDNIMGYAESPTRFDAQQMRTFRARAKRELHTDGLRPADRCGSE